MENSLVCLMQICFWVILKSFLKAYLWLFYNIRTYSSVWMNLYIIYDVFISCLWLIWSPSTVTLPFKWPFSPFNFYAAVVFVYPLLICFYNTGETLCRWGTEANWCWVALGSCNMCLVPAWSCFPKPRGNGTCLWNP